MSFLAKLNVEDEEFNVLECTYDLRQNIDESNRPIQRPIIGLIKIVIESSNHSSLLMSWIMGGASRPKDGTITFFKQDVSAASETLYFNEAFCVEYQVVFNSTDNKPMRTELVISANTVGVGDYEYSNCWFS